MKQKPLVQVNAEQYNAYRDSVKDHPDFFEAEYAGVVLDQLGCLYVGDDLVAEWSWHFNSVRQREWTYRIPAESAQMSAPDGTWYLRPRDKVEWFIKKEFDRVMFVVEVSFVDDSGYVRGRFREAAFISNWMLRQPKETLIKALALRAQDSILSHALDVDYRTGLPNKRFIHTLEYKTDERVIKGFGSWPTDFSGTRRDVGCY